jgi:hypothetical protein
MRSPLASDIRASAKCDVPASPFQRRPGSFRFHMHEFPGSHDPWSAIEHIIYHFVLTYSNWESVTVCGSESSESLSEGLQNAFWELGGVPNRHRSDSLTAAVNHLSSRREFRSRYQRLLGHYGVAGERINGRQPHGGLLIDKLPHLVEPDRQAINCRQIIDSLVRKPGAFENYRYCEDLFYNSRFRMAYDRLRAEHAPKVATRDLKNVKI